MGNFDSKRNGRLSSWRFSFWICASQSGYWYEAMSTPSDLIELYPENESLRRARRELLKQVGLEPIAQTLH